MKSKSKNTASVPSKKSFAESILEISYRFPIHQVFADFLTMAICAYTQNPRSKVSYYENEYLSVIAPYKDSEVRFLFPQALASLEDEMTERINSQAGSDVLGEFFENNLSHGRNGQFFTPFSVCQMMAKMATVETKEERPLRILDPTCGSGRMLLASFEAIGRGHEYYGIDIDPLCAKMTALNLFLHGIWGSEVMCADALRPDDFVISYRISLFPIGIFKIEKKENSKLWQMHRNSFNKIKSEPLSNNITLDTTPFSDRKKDDGTQLKFF